MAEQDSKQRVPQQDGRLPDVSSSDLNQPDLSTPDLSTPDLSVPDASKPELNRREFLRVVSGAALGLTTGGLVSTLSGCGGGSGGLQAPSGATQSASGDLIVPGSSLASVAPRVTTKIVSGRVNTTQIGGSGLKAQSMHRRDVTVASDGKFSVAVSAQGAQLLFVTDSQRKVRAAAISLPSVTSLTFDATSTALAVVMITPGILETHPTKAAQRLNEIRTYRSFAALVSFLTQNLKTIALSDLRRSPQFDALKLAVINEYRSFHGGLRSTLLAAESGYGIVPRVDNAQVGFSAEYQTGTPGEQPIKLSNSGWRMVMVNLELLNAQDRRLKLISPVTNAAQQKLDTMNGATPLSWGSLLAYGGTNVGSPTEERQVINLLETFPLTGTTTPQKIATLRYWITGIGAGLGSETPPFSVTLGAIPTIAQTVIFTCLFPIIDILVGGAGLLGKSKESIDAVWNQISTKLNTSSFTTAIGSAFKAGDRQAAAAAVLDLVLALLPIAAVAIGAVEGLPAAVGLVTGAATVVSVGTLLMTAANVDWAVGTWFAYPSTIKLDLPVSGGTIVIR